MFFPPPSNVPWKGRLGVPMGSSAMPSLVKEMFAVMSISLSLKSLPSLTNLASPFNPFAELIL